MLWITDPYGLSIIFRVAEIKDREVPIHGQWLNGLMVLDQFLITGLA